MDVADDQVRVELHLPWLLQRLAESIRGAIQTRGRFFLRTSRAISVRQSGHQDFSNGIDVED